MLISDDEDEDVENKTSWRATLKQQQQRSPPSSPDDRGAPPRQGLAGLAGLVASKSKTTPTSTPKARTPPTMSFSEAINKAKAAQIAGGEEKAPANSKASPSPPTTSQSPVPVASPAEDEVEDEDEDEDVTLRIPGSFDLGDDDDDDDDGDGAAGIDAIRMLADLWRRMQLR